MKKFKLLLPVFIFGLFFTSCSKDDDITEPITDPVEEALEVENFIYRGLNDYYLYKEDVPELADDYFSSTTKKNDFLASFSNPEELFFDGLTAPQDRFSFMTDDYIALENSFSGISTTNGMELGLALISNSNNVLAYVQYVLPNTSAEQEGIKRGDAFTIIDGVQMNLNNYQELLARDTYTITLASIANNTISQTEETVTLNKQEYTSNPVLIAKTLNIEGRKIGYLMYNSFTSNFDDELNAAFAKFEADGVTDLVLDLRYNGGGSVLTATRLASMITGQFTGETFMKEEWNQKWQGILEEDYPGWLVNEFTDTINEGQALNSLKLDEVSIITTSASASASELIINGLDPYIPVKHVGDTTVGKFQASITLYDSPNFNRAGASRNHAYAIQPLVLKSVNSAGVSDYVNGLNPDIPLEENLNNLGVLGDPSEPLLSAALDNILGRQAKRAIQSDNFNTISTQKIEDATYQRMYIDKLPPILKK